MLSKDRPTVHNGVCLHTLPIVYWNMFLEIVAAANTATMKCMARHVVVLPAMRMSSGRWMAAGCVSSVECGHTLLSSVCRVCVNIYSPFFRHSTTELSRCTTVLTVLHNFYIRYQGKQSSQMILQSFIANLTYRSGQPRNPRSSNPLNTSPKF